MKNSINSNMEIVAAVHYREWEKLSLLFVLGIFLKIFIST